MPRGLFAVRCGAGEGLGVCVSGKWENWTFESPTALVRLGLLACADGNAQLQPGRTGGSGCLLLLPLLMRREW